MQEIFSVCKKYRYIMKTLISSQALLVTIERCRLVLKIYMEKGSRPELILNLCKLEFGFFVHKIDSEEQKPIKNILKHSQNYQYQKTNKG